MDQLFPTLPPLELELLADEEAAVEPALLALATLLLVVDPALDETLELALLEVVLLLLDGPLVELVTAPPLLLVSPPTR